MQTTQDNRYLTLIGVLSVAIPLVVALLLFSPTKLVVEGDWVYFLPHLNAVLNTATAVALLAGLWFIRQRKISYHRTAMLVAFILGSIFLVSYVIYHGAADSTKYGDVNHDGLVSASELASLGFARILYLIILLSHIGLAIVVVPLVLLALYYAISNKFIQHRKVVKFAYPVWLYVSVTGVIVYLMISPYYV